MKKMSIIFAVCAGLYANSVNAATVDVKTYVTGSWGSPGDSDAVYSDSNNPPFNPTAYATSTGASGANVWALADLTSGSLKGVADSSGTSDRASFSAAMSDVFHFNIANATADTITRLFMKVHFDAEIQSGGHVILESNLLSSVNGSFDQQNHSFVSLYNSANPEFTFAYDDALGDGYDNIAFSNLGNSTIHGTFDHLLAFDVRGQTGSASFYAGVSTGGDGNGKVNFGNSAHYQFVLPDDVTFTSASGTAFTAIPAVPEPTTWAMMIAGFGAVGSAMRRRRNVTLSFG